MDYLAEQKRIEKLLRTANVTLQNFPRLANGLTPDSTKTLPEWQAAKAESERWMRSLQRHNKFYVKELRAQREQKVKSI